MSQILQRFAPAKVNLGLSVTGVLDNGYHTLHSLMVPLSVGDDLTFEVADVLTLQVTGADLPTDERNLVYRAAQAYLRAADIKTGVRITLHKKLPLASGVGGGSSDAATTLMALKELYPSSMDLHPLATSLGADVPFFLIQQAALAEGIGEKLTPVELPELHLVLVNPGTEVSARDAYLWLDQSGEFTAELPLSNILHALKHRLNVPYFNALEPAVVTRHPEIAAVLQTLRETGLTSPMMSGSGSTCFALARTAKEAGQAVQILKSHFPMHWCTAAHTLA
ncbi:4-(cytidine 5'-diphospho)-2-C-methyl-D-erythritol kinase [Deinococcus roseus]|uniref:4-diphosphocytidyl-2-C-methyl-D-erythritol kinase n=1 Tax=Deinococcus roseus TaxID=392414 RepID=A0ABQ2CVF3_9DEIO|nr:4-(cytidine 5'-diphospho)-2-C-methyl-D-erythritol kinase [Deinococcus roseus]GGJ24786.1 4-diphosphocytidyl-2-C-methyl-D-erythritol kinase [Deinococcus roseus]